MDVASLLPIHRTESKKWGSWNSLTCSICDLHILYFILWDILKRKPPMLTTTVVTSNMSALCLSLLCTSTMSLCLPKFDDGYESHDWTSIVDRFFLNTGDFLFSFLDQFPRRFRSSWVEAGVTVWRASGLQSWKIICWLQVSSSVYSMESFAGTCILVVTLDC